MKLRTITASLGAVALTAATLAVSSPASAETVARDCGTNQVTGFTQHDGQGTILTGISAGSCGTLGLRVNYSHVGGNSWTSWKYDRGGEAVHANVGSPIKSRHTTTVSNLDFYTDNE